MASLWLPAPTRTAHTPLKTLPSIESASQSLTLQKNESTDKFTKQAERKQSNLRAPSYEERCNSALKWRSLTPEERKNAKPPFVPRSIKDFDDGGAFPEIHVAQYPLHMGNPHLRRVPIKHDDDGNNTNTNKTGGGRGSSLGVVSGVLSSSAIVSAEIDANGEVSYDTIVKRGTNSDKKVYTKHSDLKGGEADPDAIKLPTTEEEQDSTAKTNAALMNLLARKTTLNKPTGSAMLNASTSANQEAKTQFISYKPSKDAPGYNPAAKQRVIQMVPAQLDPMMPPKHEHKKAPRGPAEDPVPVLHAPPTKLTKEERAKWNIPACISNWKNTRGYTIPLDKRLAADGRGLREVTVNSNFATFSESLYVAERQAREEVKMRAKVQKQLAMAEKEKREADLRELANKARMERHNGVFNASASSEPTASKINRSTNNDTKKSIVPLNDESDNSQLNEEEDEENYEDVSAAAQRERLRMARKKERERELRLEKAGLNNKKQRLEEERDVSEKIALGVHTGSGSFTNQVDSRLYNQSAGFDSGFGADDEYNTYTKPLFDRDAVAKNIYKPSQAANGGILMDAEEEYNKLKEVGTSKFQPDRGFAGTEGGRSNVSNGPRNAPVQFEKEKN